ncbi:MAG: DNA gyrase inhibitor YacG [Candidatus Nitrotoga sp.]|nr:DNA gyrase inhibitor YacG [Candidatus Nitrotoga sp.]MDO9447018.1 DNA gyrase inhibitor YacG [Candidatus Nitrotoga sp.]MDP1639072.1 DNA gyrase inhibitor YacG [Candidatus Nitrotoga sp.]MDP1855071.1 DNA gyrase inhibitor YacG [Candidatus Nitrotoga sp.]MDP3496894.1 DNA gyrase inhibitor YacG [Candidatus Nitrotoga sp.]
MLKKTTIVSCPQCKKEVPWNNGSLYRPFCSERCKLIDLGQWATETYRIPQSDSNPDEESTHQA